MSSRAFRALLAGVGVVVAVVGFFVVRSLIDDDGDDTETAPILLEYTTDAGENIPFADQVAVGEAELTRSAEGLTARAEMGGLVPGGAYTFWLVVYQGDREFPHDIFVNHGAGVVADADGRAETVMRSETGDESITGFYVEGLGGEAEFARLTEPETGRTRVEVVYHGQADDAGDELDAWLADFWTGDPNVCANPLGTLGTGDVPEHPYCAGYHAATFDPDETTDPGLSRAPSTED